MDIPLALEKLTRLGRLEPTDDWGPCASSNATYEAFAKAWRGRSAVPTRREMDDAFATVLVEQPELLLPPAERLARRLRGPVDALETRLAILEAKERNRV